MSGCGHFGKLSRMVKPLKMRAMLKHMPFFQLQLVHEKMRHDGKVGHSVVVTPVHEMHTLLTAFANTLGVQRELLLTAKLRMFETTARALLSPSWLATRGHRHR